MSESYLEWEYGVPPQTWPRLLSMDIGGATPNNMEWGAQDPVSQSLVMYAEVNKVTTDMRLMAELAMPYMKHPSGAEYQFKAKLGDYENRVALDDMKRHGIKFTNAVKQDKIKSVHRLASYLHPNPQRPFPVWHPNAGKLGSPLLFIMPACKQLITEIPQQKWKQEGKGDSMKDELDRAVRHDAVDCLLYIVRILPAPLDIPIPKVVIVEDTRSLQSKLYWADVKKAKEQKSKNAPRKAYNPAHGGETCYSLLGFSLPS